MNIQSPLTDDTIKKLKVGDTVLLSGEIFTARDAAHKKLNESIINHEKLPLELENNILYYAGPCPNTPTEVIGPIGPTTSYRQDAYTPLLLDNGIKGMIGKGNRSKEVIDSIIKNKCVYFVAIGGAALLISNSVKKAEIVGYEELGTEAIRKLEVEKLKLIVAIDCYGNNIYEKNK